MTDPRDSSEEAKPRDDSASADLLPVELVIQDHYGRQFRGLLQALPATFGRSESATVCLSDPWISHLHCEVSGNGSGTLAVRDLDSRNGVFLHGVRVLEGELRSGDCMTLGRTEVTFIYRDSSTPGEIAATNIAVTTPVPAAPRAPRPSSSGPHTEELLY